MCVFAAFWQGLICPNRTKQATSCQEEGAPLVRRNRQGVAKTCNHSRSALTQKVIIQNVKIFIIAKYLLMAISGQLRNLG